ncbi:MAG TPA: hypothetical protein ENI89_03085 [Desulfobulbus sp.]|nr:hypothetical protein [Desulfobulbus sp.]
MILIFEVRTMIGKRIILLFGILLLTSMPALAADKVPHEIGGFRLGSSIDDYDYISYRNFLKQVVVDHIGGFRKGIIEYGVCDNPGQIVKIKLKYLDSSEKFYRKLFKEFKRRFGEPDEFTGDTFGIVKSWKWHFRDKDGNRISLSLQHNLKNPDEATGNMVKLSLPERIEAERKCFNKTCASRRDAPCSTQAPQSVDWDALIPH